jgi:hypothetical protein
VCYVFSYRLCESGLLSPCRMLEGTEGPRAGPNNCAKRMVQLDQSFHFLDNGKGFRHFLHYRYGYIIT